MIRSRTRRLGTVIAIAAAVGCSSYGSGPAGLTTSEALVAGCQSVGDVSVGDGTPPNEVNAALTAEAQRKGATYVLVASEGARNGTAYRCAAPTAGTH